MSRPYRRPRTVTAPSVGKRGFAVTLLGSALVLLWLPATGAPTLSARAPLFPETQIEFPGDTTSHDFNFRLPPTIEFRNGGALQLELRPSADALAQLCMLELWLNGSILPGVAVRAVTRDEQPGLALGLQAEVPPARLKHGWNQARVVFHLNRPPGDSVSSHPGRWTLFRDANRLTVAFTRLPVFPELRRFPDTFTEVALLEPVQSQAEPPSPLVTLVLPPLRREIHLRACALLGCRLGQSAILRPHQVAVETATDWQSGNAGRQAIFVGTRYEVASLPLPTETLKKLASLRPGQGLLAEFIASTTLGPTRRLLVSGADDQGLLRALRTLGSSPALADGPPNPAIIEDDPTMLTSPSAATTNSLTLRQLGSGGIRLTGVGLSDAALSGWRLPASLEVADPSRLLIRYAASPDLLPRNSLLEVLVNGHPVGASPLEGGAARAGTWDLALPGGLPGRDPMIVTIRARLDPGPRACNESNPRPWLDISADSLLETTTRPAEIRHLGQVVRWLTRDPTLASLTLLLPDGASPETVSWFTRLSLRLGGMLPGSLVLSPDVVLYAPDAPPDANRLAGQSVLLLGSIPEWSQAIPSGTWLPVRADPDRPARVRMQGRVEPQDSFEPTVMFLQMVRSPWSKKEWLMVGGGWDRFATPLLEVMLTDPNLASSLFGNLCAMDSLGRIAGYDTRVPNSISFAEQFRDKLPAGLDLGATAARQAAQAARLRHVAGVNRIVAQSLTGLLVLLVASRLWLMWLRRRAVKTASAHEAPLDTAP